jgi:sulfide:quinone oxidoreductase
LTAALAVRHELQGDVDVRVVSASVQFLFNPSLIWLPFGKRTPADITFPLAPTFDSHGTEFVHAEATRLDLAAKKVTTTTAAYDYDCLVIATGYRNDFSVVPGLGPDGNACTITTLEDAIHAGEGWRCFLDEPGDIVVGASQGAGCFGAAYEYLFNVSHQLRKAGLKKRVKLTYVSAEPFLGHSASVACSRGDPAFDVPPKREHHRHHGHRHGTRGQGPACAGGRWEHRVLLRHDRPALCRPRRHP